MNLEHLGGFYGDHLSPAARDIIVMRHVPAKRWNVLADLYPRKWYGYRFLTPSTCLFVYADRFRKAYSAQPAPAGWKRVGTTHRIMQNPNILTYETNKAAVNRQRVTSLFMGMCFADDAGIPYDFFVGHAMKIYATEKGKLPEPNQVYQDWLLTRIDEAWQQHIKDPGTGMVTTNDWHYWSPNYKNHPWQDEYRKFLLDQILARPNPRGSIAKVCFNPPVQLPATMVAEKIGADIVRDAYSLSTLAL